MSNLIILCVIIIGNVCEAMHGSQEGWKKNDDEILQSPRKVQIRSQELAKNMPAGRTQSSSPEVKKADLVIELRSVLGHEKKRKKTKSIDNLSPRAIFNHHKKVPQKILKKIDFSDGFILRQELYKKAMFDAEKFDSAAFNEKLKTLKNLQSQPQAYAFFRESDAALKNEYAYLRYQANKTLYNALRTIYWDDELSFLQNLHEDNLCLLNEHYMNFLRDKIKPLFSLVSEEIRSIFDYLCDHAEQAQRAHFAHEAVDFKALSLTNFILYIVNPLLFQVPSNLLIFDFDEKYFLSLEKEILKDKKLYKKRKSLTEEQAVAVTDEVIAQLKERKKLLQGKADLGRQREIVTLGRLLTKTFSNAPFDENDPLKVFNEIIGGYNAELQGYKEEMKAALFGNTMQKTVSFNLAEFIDQE